MSSVTIPAPVVSTEPAPLPLAKPKERLLSLDIFRGMTLIAMVLVNMPGDERFTYAPISHVNWDGWSIPSAPSPHGPYASAAAVQPMTPAPTSPHVSVDLVTVADPEEDGRVVDEVRAGWRLGDRLLRPARVRVGRLARA